MESSYGQETKKNINYIFNLQKRLFAQCMDLKIKKRHTEHMFKKFNTLKFQDIIKCNILMIAHSVSYKYASEPVKTALST